MVFEANGRHAETFRKCGFHLAGLARGKKVLKKKTLIKP